RFPGAGLCSKAPTSARGANGSVAPERLLVARIRSRAPRPGFRPTLVSAGQSRRVAFVEPAGDAVGAGSAEGGQEMEGLELEQLRPAGPVASDGDREGRGIPSQVAGNLTQRRNSPFGGIPGDQR